MTTQRLTEPPRTAHAADPLATLLVREGLLPQARVEEAQERMLLSGGTLDTALLELGLIEEAALLELLPRAYNARGATAAELDVVDKAVTALFPRRLAEKHGVVPLDVNGRRLTLAVAGPPDLALLDEIGFMLSVYVKPAVTTQARIASALARLYGVPLPPRFEAILPRLGADVAAVRAAVDAWHARTAHAAKPKPLPPPEGAAPPADGSGWSVTRNAGLDRAAPSSPELTVADGGSLEARAIAARRAQAPADDAEELRRRQRVMWTVDDAIAELALADGRDAMLDVVLRFAYRRLATVAAFVHVRGARSAAAGAGSFVGWDVIDPLLTRQDIASFTLSADPAHALGQVLEMQSPFLGPLRKDDPLARLFGRQPRAAVLVPILVGDHFVGVLYGDCGSKSIPPSSLAELHMVVPRLGKGLGNLILRKKKALRASAQAPASPVVAPLDEGARDGGSVGGAPHAAPGAPASQSAAPPLAPALARAREAQARASVSALIASTPVGASSTETFPQEPMSLALRGDMPESIEIDALDDFDELEEDIAVSAPAPARAVPTIEIDLSDIDVVDAMDAAALTETIHDASTMRSFGVEVSSLDAPAGLSSEPPPGSALPAGTLDGRAEVEAPTQLSSEPVPMPWADGRDDDEDVRLDDGFFAELDAARAAPIEAARIELGLDEELLASDEGPPVDDAPADAPVDAAPVEAAPVVVQEAPATDRVPGFRVDPSGEGAAVDAIGPGTIAASPGARGRETLLLATHAQWVAHEDAVLDELVGQMHGQRGEAQQRAAVAAVTAHGDRAMPSLARSFPGVLAVHPFGAMETRPEVAELSDCVACLVKLGADSAAPILVAELAHDDRLHRWAAVWTLSALHVPGALPRLAQRIFDPERAIAALALEVLDGYRGDAAFEKVLAQVRDLVRRGDPFERQRAIQAVGELKDREALPALVDLLGTRPKEIAEEARRALVEISKQDFGGAERRWRAWIADNASTPRTRWLIDGLASKDDDIRRSAQQELNRATGQFFGYRWDAPRADREQSLSAWEEWWSAQQAATKTSS